MWPSEKMPTRQAHVDAVLGVLKTQKGRKISVQTIMSLANLSRTAVFGVIELLAAEHVISVDGKLNSIKAEVSLSSES